MNNSLQEYLNFANKLADAAGITSMEYFRTSLSIDNKSDESPVTIADKNTELKIRSMIEKKYPNHGILGEEFDSVNPNAEFIWVIDPIDGTNDYVEVPFATSMNPTGDFTVNVWVKTGASNDFQSSVTSRTDTINGNEGGGFMVYIATDEQWSFWAGDGATDDTWAQVNSTTDINIGTWQMQTVTFQESTNIMKLYADGVLIKNGDNMKKPLPEIFRSKAPSVIIGEPCIICF